jgi:hypothetical protein
MLLRERDCWAAKRKSSTPEVVQNIWKKKKKGRKRKRTESDLHKKESDTRNQTIENWKMEKYIRQCHCVRSPEWGAFQHQLPLGHYLTEV